MCTGKILKSEMSAEPPIELSTKIKWVINLDTAKTLCLDFRIALPGRADEVIE